MKKIILSLLFVIMMSSYSFAGIVQVVAVVNDDIITSYDFHNRVNMAISNASLPKTKEALSKVAQIVMQELIYEKLKIQAASKVGISVTEKEVDEAILTIAKRNNMDMEAFYKNLEDSELPIDTLIGQIEACILWNKYVAKMIENLKTDGKGYDEEKIKHIKNK